MVAVALILVVLLIVFIVRQGRGHTPRLVDDHVGSSSRTLIELAAPRTLLTEHLKQRPDFIAARVSAYEVDHAPMLKITAQCRRGTSPADAARAITDALHAVDRILGTSTP